MLRHLPREVPISVAAQHTLGVEPLEQRLCVLAADPELIADLGDAGRAVSSRELDDRIAQPGVGRSRIGDVAADPYDLLRRDELTQCLLDPAPLGGEGL